MGQEKVSCDLVDIKLAIFCYKNIDLKKSKMLHFSEGFSEEQAIRKSFEAL